MLDLRLQRERHRTLAPVEQVREAAVGDHDVGKGVRPRRDCCQRLPVRLVIESQLQDADRLAATRDGSEDPEATEVRDDLDLLLGERTTVRCTRERDRWLRSRFTSSSSGLARGRGSTGSMPGRCSPQSGS